MLMLNDRKPGIAKMGPTNSALGMDKKSESISTTGANF